MNRFTFPIVACAAALFGTNPARGASYPQINFDRGFNLSALHLELQDNAKPRTGPIALEAPSAARTSQKPASTLNYDLSRFAPGKKTGEVKMVAVAMVDNTTLTVEMPLPRTMMESDAAGKVIFHFQGRDHVVGRIRYDQVAVEPAELFRLLIDYFYGLQDARRLTKYFEGRQNNDDELAKWMVEPISYADYKLSLGKIQEKTVEENGIRVTWNGKEATTTNKDTGDVIGTYKADALAKGGQTHFINRVFLKNGLLAISIQNDPWSRGDLLVYEAKSGKLLWTEAPWAAIAYLQMSNDRLYYWRGPANYVGYASPEMRAFRAVDGRPYWSADIDEKEFALALVKKIKD